MSGQALLQLNPVPAHQRKTPQYRSCNDKHVHSCHKVDVNFDLLKAGEVIELPDGLQPRLIRRGDNSAVFKVWGSQWGYLLDIVCRMRRLRLFSAGLGPILQEVFMLEDYLRVWKDVVKNVFFGAGWNITGWMKQLHQASEIKLESIITQEIWQSFR